MDKEAEPIKVFYDGKMVALADGDVIVSSTKAMESNIFVQGTEKYSVVKKTEGDVVYFTLDFGGEVFTFGVRENIVNEIPTEKSGCSSSVTMGNAILAVTILSFCVIVAIRRKRYE
jgi:hypothetical protein